MSLEEDILSKCFGIKSYKINKIVEDKSKLIFEAERTGCSFCPKCGNVAGRYDSSIQEFLIGTLNSKSVYIRCKIYRIKCAFDGVITENHNISEGKKRYSKVAGSAIVHYTEKLDNKAASQLFGISPSSVYRIDYEELSDMEKRYLDDLPRPEGLSVDEVSYKRRHHYATVLSDYNAGKVLWIEKDRKQSDLESVYDLFGDKLQDVKTITMDFWRCYETATKNKLPHASIIYDRFHLSRLLNRHVETERRAYQRSLSDIDRKHVKRNSRWILLKRQDNLSEKNLEHLQELKQVNNRLYELYLLKESFLSIFTKTTSIKVAIKLIFSWIRDIRKLDFTNLKRFTKSILKRIRNILKWFKHYISNGKAEGINNVIKTLIKRGYGYKNFDYFRMKVLQKCGRLMNYATHSF